MTADSERVLYLHGFNSSPESSKARSLVHYCRERFPRREVIVPQLSHDPAKAVAMMEGIMRGKRPALLVGSSLGGYYATYLVDKFAAQLPQMKAALINPAVSPWRTLSREFLGWHRNPYTGEEYELLPRHVDVLRTLEVERVSPERFLLLAQTGDEVLDYGLAVAKYAGARMIVQDGGNHAFDNFEAVLPDIFAFADKTISGQQQ